MFLKTCFDINLNLFKIFIYSFNMYGNIVIKTKGIFRNQSNIVNTDESGFCFR